MAHMTQQPNKNQSQNLFRQSRPISTVKSLIPKIDLSRVTARESDHFKKGA